MELKGEHPTELTPADKAKLKALTERIESDFATLEDMEAATELLAKHNYKAPVSLKLLDLADKFRERLAANPKFAEEVRKLMDKDKKS